MWLDSRDVQRHILNLITPKSLQDYIFDSNFQYLFWRCQTNLILFLPDKSSIINILTARKLFDEMILFIHSYYIIDLLLKDRRLVFVWLRKMKFGMSLPGGQMTKAVPNKNAGFIILLTSIFTLFFCGEIRNLTTFTRLMDYNNGFSLSPFFLSLHSFLWIGSQFPQEKFLSYGRILTLYYYFLLMCILFSQDYYYIYFF